MLVLQTHHIFHGVGCRYLKSLKQNLVSLPPPDTVEHAGCVLKQIWYDVLELEGKMD
jgi:hypothetical protein